MIALLSRRSSPLSGCSIPKSPHRSRESGFVLSHGFFRLVQLAFKNFAGKAQP
jgi:hypothetical protein